MVHYILPLYINKSKYKRKLNKNLMSFIWKITNKVKHLSNKTKNKI